MEAMRTITKQITLPLFILMLPGCSTIFPKEPHPGRALFEDRCKNVAGEKIYRRVENVEGIYLINIRTRATKDEDTLNYPGAALTLESYDNDYIETFLAYEHGSFGPGGKITPEYRGYVNRAYLPRNPINLRGYKFVDAIDSKDGARYRYTLAKNPAPNASPEIIDYVLERKRATEPPPRFGISFEDHVIPSERALGLASTTVRVVDMTNHEILGEFTAYSYGGSVDAKNQKQRVNWLAADKCPKNKSGGSNSRTRQFVDRVLIPMRGD